MGRVQAGDGGSERQARREWSLAQKLQILRESERPGTIQLEVCRRHRLHPSLLTKWRTRERAGLLGRKNTSDGRTRLLPVRVQPTPAIPAAEVRAPKAAFLASGSGWGAIEVEFATGRRVCVRGTVDAGMLRTVLEELSRS